ncbi:MAG: hypothetical protein PHQ19_01045 [Candidatus Krumholzibacteria bacterium]|nr:hypothetical protein [Candidatus Krumholzibacteria bacterium]
MRRVCTAWILLALAMLGAQAVARASIAVDEEEVVFRLEAPGAGQVSLVGDFNGWNPTLDRMTGRRGPWEIRLFLVPGRYRYQFVVDGERIADPDNPHCDPDGTSYFIFTETDGEYAIVFERPLEGAAAADETWRLRARGAAVADSAAGLFAGAAGLEGEAGAGVGGSILVGFEYESGGGGADGPRAYLLRARGGWESERGSIEAFHRDGRLDFGDPLSLFGTVGPFRYPLGLFARGAQAALSGPFGIAGRAFYANRIEGYRSGLEWAQYGDSLPGLPSTAGLREDADIAGLSLAVDAGIVDLEYLLRSDRGPDLLYWEEIGDPGLCGYRELRAQGGVLRIGPLRGVTLTGELLRGRTEWHEYLHWNLAAGRDPVDVAVYEWEDGYRAAAGVRFERGSAAVSFDWGRTTVSGAPELREGRPEGIQDILEARFEGTAGAVRGTARIRRESFEGAGNTGRVFWLVRRNFWLDGDRITTGMLPFLDAPVVWEAELRFERERPDTMPGPYRLDGYIAGLVRFEPSSDGAAVYELTAGQGIAVHRLLSLHADLRYVAYQDCGFTGDGGFIDAWFGMRAPLSAGGWLALGVGVPPHRFDRWLFEFAGDGREAYLLDSGVLGRVDHPLEEDLLLPGLEEAEKSLSEEWSIRFEAGLAF